MLDIQLRNLLDHTRASGVPDMADVPFPAAREIYSAILAAGDLPVADVDITERRIDGPDGALTLRLYRPRTPGKARGAVLYSHGGGFCLGRPQDYDGVCSTLCLEADCVVVQCDYRLAPEHPFPAAVDDSWAALNWLAAHAGSLGADPARLIVAGDSAGANLTAVLALLARDQGGPALRQQTLIYPVVTTVPGQFESARRFGEGYTLTNRLIERISGAYVNDAKHLDDWRAGPLLAADLSALPPALLMVAGFDPLRDEGIAYADKLADAGTQVSLIDYPGLAHGFISMGGALTAARLAVSQVATAWRLAFARGTQQESPAS